MTTPGTYNTTTLINISVPNYYTKESHYEQSFNSSSTFNSSGIDAPGSSNSLVVNFLLGVFCVTVSGIGLPVSILIISVIAKFRELRTYQNAFVASLVSRDMIITGLLLPIFYADIILGFYPFGKQVCLFQLLVAFSISLGSVLELMNIAVSRYVKVCCNIGTYRLVYTKRNTSFFVAGTWMLGFIFGAPAAINYGRLSNYTHVCFIQKSPLKAAVTSVILGIAVAVTLFCYINIWRTVREAKENLRRFNEGPRRHRTVNHNFQTFLRDSFVFIIYLFLLLPFVLLNSFGLSSPRFLPWDIAKLLSFTNNFTNCVIYGLLNKQIRVRIFRLLSCYKNRPRTNVVTPYMISVNGISRTTTSFSLKRKRCVLETYAIAPLPGDIASKTNDTTI